MNRLEENSTARTSLTLAFAIPCVGMLFVMLISQYEPFGNYSILYSDMYHQYYPFFLAFRNALRSGESLLYNWDVGLGLDYLGLISYYLASPLNLLSVLVPEVWLLEFFSLLMPLRLGLAGLFFAIFLRGIFKREDISIAMFGAFYALCAWALGYQWNIMWLDTFALLPLVALGTISLLRDKKFALYTLSLFVSVFSNYYVGFFTCIFVLLLFVVYQICRWQGVKRFFQDLFRIAGFSVLAIGMTAILELPAFAALQTTQSSVNQFPKGFRLNIADENTWLGLLDAMRQVAGNMNGCIEPTYKEGLPNVFCGTGVMLLFFLYLTAKEVKLRDKICAVGLLIFFMISFIIRQLDYIWHGFHFTNMIPYRFSFLYSFVMLYMAYRAWTIRHSFRLWQIVMGAGLCIGVLACCKELQGNLLKDNRWLVLLYNLGFLAVYCGALVYGQLVKTIPEEENERGALRIRHENRRRKMASRIMIQAVMGLELIAILVNFGLTFTGTSVTHYPRGKEYTASVISYMKEREAKNLFFRAETTHSQTLNDGALNGYNGISTFSSSANVRVTEFMRVLGYGAKNTYNRYCYEEASPVSNLFLGLKYMIERNGKDKTNAYFDEINRYGDAVLLANNAYLPLGFLADAELAEVDFFGELTGFQLQNLLVNAASGIEGDAWRILSGEDVAITGTDVEIYDQNSSGYCAYKNGKKGAAIVYTYEVDADGYMCVELNLPKRNDVAIWKNGVELYTESMSLPQMLAVGDVTIGDVVEIRATCKNANESGTATITAAILNEQRFRECHNVLNASTLNLTAFENTYVAGTISCNRDGLLYTSIPQNGNWFVKVDGEEVETLLVGDVMVAVMLPEGDHTVEFLYRNPAFELGWKISAGCGILFAVLVYISRLPKTKGGKYAKK